MSFIFLRNRVTGGAAFTPASLFSSGEEGAWYEPSPTTCFTDTAGTTAAGVGDAVARINDLSGNGNHATQGTAAARPLLQQTAGGLYYLAFDGSDDFLQSAPTGWAATQTAWMSAGASSSNASTAVRCLIASVSNGGYASNNNGEYILLEVNRLFENIWSISDVGGDTDQLGSLSPDITAPNVITGFSDATNAKLRRNGSEVATAATQISGAIIDLNQEIDIGAIDNSGLIIVQSPLNLFGLIIRLDPPSAQELSDAETYLAAKSGVTL